MKIAYITAGAAGMYCGSCMKDNTLAAALNRLGHDCLLIPTYTPIRTDEEDVSQQRVFFGGINVFLQQHSWLFRHTPWLADRLLDVPRLLRWVSRFAVRTRADKLGGLTVSMLQGAHGRQRKEVRKLVEWLASDFQPDVVVLTNVLLSGLVPELKRAWNRPVIGELQGDDIFLEMLPPKERAASIELIRMNGSALDGYIASSEYYADFMSGYLGLRRNQIDVVHPGLNLKGHGEPIETRTAPPYTIGYFARVCPEKGFHNVVDAFLEYRQLADAPAARLRVSGWLGENNRKFFDEQMAKLHEASLAGEVDHIESPSHADKVTFLRTLDLLSVPTVYREPKGLYVLEALANGVPVVQPRHGSFPELLNATDGGTLVEPNDPKALAQAWAELLGDPAARRRMGESGASAVRARFTADEMARRTLDVLAGYHERYRSRTSEAVAP